MIGNRLRQPVATKKHSSELIFEGKVFSVRRHATVEPGGLRVVREVVHHGGSAVILPWLPDGTILLVRQFRLPAARFLWELPAGSIARGETPLQTARRELAEETGCRAASWRKLTDFYPSPGFLDEKMTLFLARNIRQGLARPEEDEQLQLRRFSQKQLRKMLQDRKIQDGKTLVGLFYFLSLDAQQK